MKKIGSPSGVIASLIVGTLILIWGVMNYEAESAIQSIFPGIASGASYTTPIILMILGMLLIALGIDILRE